mgnify:CR=1 FL=1
MKHKIKDYANLISNLIDSGSKDKALFEKLINLISKNGQLKNAKLIINLAESYYLAKRGNKKIILETAMPLKSLDFLKGFKREGDIVVTKITKEIVAGIKIVINNQKQLDYSLQKSLDEVFK